MDKERRTFHCIKPRYTFGAPCITYFEFAKQFSVEERNAYRSIMRGDKGQLQKERAERLGLDDIASTRIKHKDNSGNIYWYIIDLITNKQYQTKDGVPPETEYRPLYIISIEIMNSWDEPNEQVSEYISNMRQLNYLSDRLPDSTSAAEIVIKFLINSKDWSDGRIIKKELKQILCNNFKQIEDENVQAMAKVICKRDY